MKRPRPAPRPPPAQPTRPVARVAISYPIDPGRPYFSKQPDRWAGPLSAANGYRWVSAGVVTLPANFDPSTNQWTSAATAGDINGLLVYPVWLNPDDPTAANQAAIVTGPAEVSDAAIRYLDLDHDEVNERLRELGIIVREAILLPPD